MAVLTSVIAKPIIGYEGDYIVLAATVIHHIRQSGRDFLGVATWTAGEGMRYDKLSAAEFESWRRSFIRPGAVD